MSPSELIKSWVDYFNEGNAGKIASLYHDNATNHQVANEAIHGKANIEAMFEREFSSATMHCISENIFEDGEWGILEWKDPNSLRGSGFFQVVDNKIAFQRGYWDKLSFLELQKSKHSTLILFSEKFIAR